MASTKDENVNLMTKTAKPEVPKKAKKVVKAKSNAGKKKRRHKPKDFPKRPLSAYNIFFKETREQILIDNEGKEDIAFQTMAKEIAARWKELEPGKRERVDSLAKEDMKRYREEVKNYEEMMVKKCRKDQEESEKYRLQQEVERAEAEKKASSEAAVAAAVLGASGGSSSGLPGMMGMSGASLGLSSLEGQVPGVGGLELDMLRREQIQMRLLEELRAVEARAMQVRQLQSQFGLPTNEGGGFGADLLQGRQSILSPYAREPPMSEYELLLRSGLSPAGLASGGLAPVSGVSGLLNLHHAGLGSLNAGLLSQVPGLGGLQGLPVDQNTEASSLLQSYADLVNKQNAGANAPY
jgi:hypothetical protein